MRVLVIGGTGRTGRLIVKELVKAGHQPVLFSRRELDTEHPTVVGDLLNIQDIERALDNVQAVITALSIPRASRSPFATITGPTDLHSRSTSLLVQAMEHRGIERFVKISAHAVGSSAPRAGWLFRALIAVSNLKPAFDDHAIADQRLAASQLAYTIVRPPMLKDSEIIHDVVADNLQTTWSWTRVTTGSVAHWIVAHLEDQTTWRIFTSLLPA